MSVYQESFFYAQLGRRANDQSITLIRGVLSLRAQLLSSIWCFNIADEGEANAFGRVHLITSLCTGRTLLSNRSVAYFAWYCYPTNLWVSASYVAVVATAQEFVYYIARSQPEKVVFTHIGKHFWAWKTTTAVTLSNSRGTGVCVPLFWSRWKSCRFTLSKPVRFKRFLETWTGVAAYKRLSTDTNSFWQEILISETALQA